MSAESIHFGNIMEEARHAFHAGHFRRAADLLDTARNKALVAEAEHLRLASHNLTPREVSRG